MSVKHAIDLPDDLAAEYFKWQVLLMGHRINRTALRETLNDRAARGLPVPVIEERVDPFELRTERATRRKFHLLDVADTLTLADWSDLEEFHTFGQATAELMTRRFEDADYIGRLGDWRPHEVERPAQRDAERAEETVYLLRMRQFFRLCAPAPRRALLHFAGNLDVPGHGLVLYRDQAGERLALPYIGTRELSRAG